MFPGTSFHLVATKEDSELCGLALVHHLKLQSAYSGCEEGNPRKKAALKFAEVAFISLTYKVERVIRLTSVSLQKRGPKISGYSSWSNCLLWPKIFQNEGQ